MDLFAFDPNNVQISEFSLESNFTQFSSFSSQVNLDSIYHDMFTLRADIKGRIKPLKFDQPSKISGELVFGAKNFKNLFPTARQIKYAKRSTGRPAWFQPRNSSKKLFEFCVDSPKDLEYLFGAEWYLSKQQEKFVCIHGEIKFSLIEKTTTDYEVKSDNPFALVPNSEKKYSLTVCRYSMDIFSGTTDYFNSICRENGFSTEFNENFQ